MTPTSHVVRIGGFRTKYLEAGDPADPPVVFIHEGSFGADAASSFGAVMAELAEDYHVLAPDLLGWGGTDKVAFLDRSPYVPRVEHVAAFCDSLALTDVRFVGNSFGGSLVLRAAAGTAPAWPMHSAVSISGTGGPDRLPEATAAIADYTPSLEDARRLTGWLVEDPDVVGDHVQQRYQNSLIPGHWEVMNAPRLKNPALAAAPSRSDPYPDSLSQCAVPILLVEGRHDRMLEPAWSERLVTHLPKGERIVVDAAHSPNIDKPALVVRLLRDFFGRS